MYIGEPQPLWWIGTHHREESVWPKIVELITTKPNEPLFEIAFNEYLHSGDSEKVCSVPDESPQKDK